MVNNYKKKPNQRSWDENLMARAIKEINDKRGSVKSIALKCNIPRTTLILRRHIATGSAKKKLGRYKFRDYLIKD